MRLLLTILMIVACAACSAGGASVEIGGERFSVELAETTQKQTLGLMYRDEMPADHGMLFIFKNEAPRSFWMKNCRFPQDIMYFDKDLIMVSASLDTPPCRVSRCPSYPSKAPAMYVLELNAGTAARLGVGPGSQLTVNFD
jgi:uncharacterized membrane protein (UPF0127 family)